MRNMTQFYVNYLGERYEHAGPYSSLNGARKKAIGIYKSKKSRSIISISKDSTKGLYGYIMDTRNDPDYPCDWAYCTANQERYWAIKPDGTIDYAL